jgi:oligoribonuclease
MNDRLVWIDCEMTGLRLDADALIEVAALVTDFELQVLGEGIDVVVKPPAEALAQMSPVVTQMHTASGLLAELGSGVDLATAESMVLDYIREFVPEAGRAPLAGNTVGTDRLFLSRDMPRLESHLHYRIVDVSSIKELARRWYPRAYFASPQKLGNHRALADITESIEELRYYRAAVFVPGPGPDSQAARALAAEHGGSISDSPPADMSADHPTDQSADHPADPPGHHPADPSADPPGDHPADPRADH